MFALTVSSHGRGSCTSIVFNIRIIELLLLFKFNHPRPGAHSADPDVATILCHLLGCRHRGMPMGTNQNVNLLSLDDPIDSDTMYSSLALEFLCMAFVMRIKKAEVSKVDYPSKAKVD
jgi:hypothetical protein